MTNPSRSTAPTPTSTRPKPKPKPGRPLTARKVDASAWAPKLDLDKLLAARLHAARARPYLATALFALHVVESPGTRTMAVDRYWRCYVAPAFVARTLVEDLASVWVHEVSHLLRDHHGRGERYAREHDLTDPAHRLRMNVAADFEINDDAYGDGLVRPAGAVGASMLRLQDGLLMEEYLPYLQLRSFPQSMAWLDCGSGADGHERPWDLGPDGAHGLSEQERDAVRFRVAQGITGNPGRASRGWRRWAEEAFQPPQPWHELLGAALRAAVIGGSGRGDYSYGRPARRSASLPGIVLPSLRRTPPRVSVVIDTSGSVSDEELGRALREVAAICRAVGGRRDLVSVVPCDAAADRVLPLCREADLELVGGGGTDLRAGFIRALKAASRPDVIVALTDGQTPWPSQAPPCRTVVGLFGRHRVNEDDEHYRPVTPPSWARAVEIRS